MNNEWKFSKRLYFHVTPCTGCQRRGIQMPFISCAFKVVKPKTVWCGNEILWLPIRFILLHDESIRHKFLLLYKLKYSFQTSFLTSENDNFSFTLIINYGRAKQLMHTTWHRLIALR